MGKCSFCKVVDVGKKRVICLTCSNKQDRFVRRGKQNIRRKGSE